MTWPPVVCILEDCDRTMTARGFCRAHYRELVKSGKLWTQSGRNQHHFHEPRVCEYDGCGLPHRARGWCTKHYHRAKYGRPMGDPAVLEWDVVRDYIGCGYSAPHIAKRVGISESRLFSLIRENEPAMRRRIGVAA